MACAEAIEIFKIAWWFLSDCLGVILWCSSEVLKQYLLLIPLYLWKNSLIFHMLSFFHQKKGVTQIFKHRPISIVHMWFWGLAQNQGVLHRMQWVQFSKFPWPRGRPCDSWFLHLSNSFKHEQKNPNTYGPKKASTLRRGKFFFSPF